MPNVLCYSGKVNSDEVGKLMINVVYARAKMLHLKQFKVLLRRGDALTDIWIPDPTMIVLKDDIITLYPLVHVSIVTEDVLPWIKS